MYNVITQKAEMLTIYGSNSRLCRILSSIWSTALTEIITFTYRYMRKLVEAEREKNGHNAQATMLIVDSKSIQNVDTAEEKGYDAGKKYLE